MQLSAAYESYILCKFEKSRIMGVVKSIDKELKEALPLLTDRQKKTVLSVVKTFLEDAPTYDPWQDAHFVKEIDKRFSDYESGKVKGFTLEEVEAEARLAYKSEQSKK
jgi:hypothetical protein